jgi:hypothetical protein
MNNKMIDDLNWRENVMQEADDEYRRARHRKRKLWLVFHYIPILTGIVMWLLGYPSDVCILIGGLVFVFVFIMSIGFVLDTMGGRGDDAEAAKLAVKRYEQQNQMITFDDLISLTLWIFPIVLTFCVLYIMSYIGGAWVATVAWFLLTLFGHVVISEAPLEAGAWT